MKDNYRHSPESEKALRDAFTNKPELRQKLTNLISDYQKGEKSADRSLASFLSLNETVASEIASPEAFSEAERIFNDSMRHQSFANPRSDKENNVIRTFQKFAELAYSLVEPDEHKADLEARGMWNGVKRVYSQYH